MRQVWAVVDGAVQTAALFTTKAAAEEYAANYPHHEVMRTWVFKTVDEARLRDEGWARGDLNWQHSL